MKNACCALLLTIVVLGMSTRSQAQTSTTPGWLRFLGDGSEGPFSCNPSPCVLGDEHWFSSFTVPAGATLATTGQNGPIIIRSTGTCTIAGTMSDSANIPSGNVTITGAGDFGGSGGGGGGGSGAGQNGLSTFADAGLIINNGGLPGAVGGGVGGDGSTPVVTQYRLLLGGGTFWPVGGAAGGAGGNGGGLGGYGGGPVILVCNSIDFTGTIDVSGGKGSPPTGTDSGSGGGGGGGYVILSAASYVANTGTINTAGGPGGSCNGNSGCGVGGSGGNGWNVSFTIQ